ncbi:hypothetical protein EV175_000798 [Coemansia sp. RSA 1933]|nr:hypothetical protein EV175_000798 [Coemansia sp. RSA 1933]
MSKVEFGICVDGWSRVVFKTVNDPELSVRELYFHHKIATSRSEHLVRLVDEFTDNSNKNVMVFPRMNSTEIYGHDLFDIGYIARQLFTALEELHSLGIAHLDITPTNIMSDPNDPSHVEIIDFGLACDISTAVDGYLPSRGTCGFVAPEVLAGNSNDLRADIYSAGVVLGMMLQKYLPTVNLRLLGGPLVRSDTTDAMIVKLDELLEAYKYEPESVGFVDCNTTFIPPLHITDSGNVAIAAINGSAEAHPPSQPFAGVPNMADSTPYGKETGSRSSRCYFDKSDDEAAACAAAYMGGGAMYGGYGDFSDDEDGCNYPGASNTRNSRSYSNSGGSSRANGLRAEPNPIFHHPNASGTAVDHYDQNLNSFEVSGRNYCTASPTNTPVYARSLNEAASSSTRELSNIRDILENSTSSSSNARYASCNIPTANGSTRSHHGSLNLQTYRAVAIRTCSSTQSSASSGNNESGCSSEHVKKPGRVPEAVIHAADLLRWTLQANPQCRPTATQALEHPFLASIGIKRKQRQHLSTSSSPITLIQDGPGWYWNHESCRAELKDAIDRCAPFSGGHAPRLAATCKTRRSDSGITTEPSSSADSPAAMCDGACDEALSSCGNSKDSVNGSAEAQANVGMFKDATMDSIHLWEKEMHSRLASYPSSIHGERSVDYEATYTHRNSSYGHGRDEINSFYSSNCDDITSYFY